MAIILDNKRISESMPLDYTIERLGYDDFIKSIEEFLGEYFRGLAELEVKTVQDGTVVISAHGFAYFLRKLIVHIFGKELLKIKMLAQDMRIYATLSYKSDTPLPEDVKVELERVARLSGFNTGFDFDGENATVLATITLEERSYLSIYAKNNRKMRYALNQIFFLEF